MKRQGFTLHELLIASTLIACVMFYSLPSISFFSRTLIDEEIESLQQLFLYLQLKATASLKECILTFDCKNNCYSYCDENNKEKIIHLSSGIEFGVKSNVYGPPSKPEHIISEPCSFPRNESLSYHVTFFPSLTISPGAVYLYCNQHDQLRALTISINSTAVVRKYRFEKNRWQQYG